MTLKLSQKAALLILVPFFFELAFVITLVNAQRELEAQYKREFREKDELSAINSELRVMLEAGTALAMFHAVRDDKFYERYLVSRADAKSLQKRLLVMANYDQELDLLGFNRGVAEVLSTIDKMEDLARAGDRLDLMRNAFAGNALAGKISALGNTILSRATQVGEAQRLKQASLRAGLNIVVLLGVFLNAILVIIIGLFFHKSTTSRLNVLWRNSRNLAQDKPLEQDLTGGDEIALIDSAFHQMAEALEHAKHRELALTENAVDVICAFEASGKIQRINRAAYDLWGYEPQSLIGSSIVDLVKAEQRNLVAANLQRIIESEDRNPFELTMLRRDGVECTVQWSLRWSAAESAFFAVIHDVSERKRVERLKQEVLSMVSHDLRAPLTALDMGLSLLQTGNCGELNAEGNDVLAKSRNSLSRLISMINDLLDMEKLESGVLELSYSHENLARLVDEALEALVSLAEARGIAFQCDTPDLMLDVDRIKIVSVLLNLLSNAIKFSPEDSVIKIEIVKTDKLDAATNCMLPWGVEIRVIDQGRGVPLEKRELIFERFKQSERSDESELKGAGLGLAICKAIVQAHGGEIGVSANDTAGSCFWFKLPAVH